MTPRRNPKHPPVQLDPWKPSAPPRTTRELAALKAKHAIIAVNLRDHDRAMALGMTTAAYQMWRRRRLAETAPSAPPRSPHYRSASDMPLAEASAYYGVPAPRVAAARSRARRRR